MKVETELDVGDIVYSIDPLFEDINKMRITQIVIEVSKKSTNICYFGTICPGGLMHNCIENWHKDKASAREAIAKAKSDKVEELVQLKRARIEQLRAELAELEGTK